MVSDGGIYPVLSTDHISDGMTRSAGDSARSRDQLTPAVGTRPRHTLRARRAESALVAADERWVPGVQGRLAFLALRAHLEGHGYRTTGASSERQSRYPLRVMWRLSGPNNSGLGCPVLSSMGVKTSM